MITWKYEWDGAKLVYNYEPNEGSYFIGEEAHNNIIEHEHLLKRRKERGALTTQYYYPNEVEIVIEDGKRVAYLKDNWREIREKNERTISRNLRDIKVPWSFWKPENYYWGA